MPLATSAKNPDTPSEKDGFKPIASVSVCPFAVAHTSLAFLIPSTKRLARKGTENSVVAIELAVLMDIAASPEKLIQDPKVISLTAGMKADTALANARDMMKTRDAK